MWRNGASFHLEGCSENVPAQITQSVLSELDLLELLNLFFLTDFVFACFTTFAFEFFPLCSIAFFSGVLVSILDLSALRVLWHSVVALSCVQTTALEESRRQLSLIWLCGVGVAE